VRRAKRTTIVAGLVVLWARGARADGPLGAQGTRITTSRYTFDVFTGPVLASARVTAMAGAYTAIADGTEGITFNAAAPAIRPPYSTTRDDYDLTGSVTFSNLPFLGQASVIATDLENKGQTSFSRDAAFVWATGGFTIQHDQAGIGVLVSGQQYTPRHADATKPVLDAAFRLFRVDAVASYGFLGDRLYVGGGIRGIDFETVDTSGDERLLFRSFGVGVQGGALWAPRELPMRVGGTVRSPIVVSRNTGTTVQPRANGDVVVSQHGLDFYLPEAISLPWELEWGVALQLGPRPLNVAWTDEDTVTGPEVERERRVVDDQIEPVWRGARRLLKKRYAALPRRKVLLSFSTLVTGPTANAVGFESMLAGNVDRAGRTATATARVGAEAEVLPNRLQLRGGTYLEPTRFRDVAREPADDASHACPNGAPPPGNGLCVVGVQPRPRLHGTFGFEVRLFEWTVFGLADEGTSWRVTAAGDYARDYYGYSLAIGLWH
jgi:hypothetical protein